MATRSILGASIGTAALAGLLFGFDTAVIAGVEKDLRAIFGLSALEWGGTVSAALWGTLAGALLAGIPGDRFGSRNSLRGLAVLYMISALGCALTWNWGSFIAFRVITGIAIGGSSVLAPVYISEVAPPARRGTLVGLFQFNIVFGILLAFASNAIVGQFALGEADWRWKLGIAAAPALVLFALLFRIPNSPRWLVARGRRGEAEHALTRIGYTAGAATDEAGAIAANLAAEQGRARPRLSWRQHRRPIILAILLAMFNQLAGINAILYYLNGIFERAGSLSPDLQAVTVAGANLLFTMVGMALIDRIGRKTLLMIGAAGMTLCLGATAAVLNGQLGEGLLLPALIGFIAFFAVSQGAVIWVYLSEIFPTPVRARGSALGSSTHWLMNALVAWSFPRVTEIAAPLPFVIFAGSMAVQLVVVWLFFPETKGVALENMDARMKETQA